MRFGYAESDEYDALKDADALIICTEWAEFRTPDLDRVKAALRKPVIFDGRNLSIWRPCRRKDSST